MHSPSLVINPDFSPFSFILVCTNVLFLCVSLLMETNFGVRKAHCKDIVLLSQYYFGGYANLVQFFIVQRKIQRLFWLTNHHSSSLFAYTIITCWHAKMQNIVFFFPTKQVSLLPCTSFYQAFFCQHYQCQASQLP